MATEVNPACNHLSASSIASYKACPTRYRLTYREGLRPARDADVLRIGTNWHALHEVYASATHLFEAGLEAIGVDVEEVRMAAVVAHLNTVYTDVPAWKDAHEWALERQILLTSFIGYRWYWQNDPVEFLASEVPFNLPLHEPRTGMPLSLKSVQRVGKIDHVIRYQGGVCALERKSTSKSVLPDSDFWQKWQKDTQISMYSLAFEDLKNAKLLPDSVPADAPRYGNTLIDIWHKPTIKPCMLTQAETKAVWESGEYAGQKFLVKTDGQGRAWVDEAETTVEMGKKEGSFAIKETVEMFAARLLADIYERPEYYFARREIAHTAEEIRQFRAELFAIYQSQSLMAKYGSWFSNESQCRATFACQYIPICYGLGANAVCDGKTTPDNYKRIFVDLTVRGYSLDE